MFAVARRTLEEFRAAKALLADGLGVRATGRRLAIPYSTVRYWTALDVPPWTPRQRYPSWEGPSDPAAYCHMLGLYLGDGCINEFPRGSPRLDITLDRRYGSIVAEARAAIEAGVPGARTAAYGRPGAVLVCAHHPEWTVILPQHGPGRKHTRLIKLVDWQRELTHSHPEALIRGLIHSDGSRCINRFKTKLPSGRVAEYSYVRYFFTNYSADIREIFCEHCELLGIRWTRSSFKNISVSHRDSVAILDSFVGPKE